MHTFILLDYSTIRAASGTVTQNESGWLDLTPYQDLVFWIDTRNASTSAVTLRIQTSPTKDEALFTDMFTAFSLTSTGAVTQKQALLGGGTTLCPVARYVRWVLVGPGAAWDATLRIYVAANSPGM